MYINFWPINAHHQRGSYKTKRNLIRTCKNIITFIRCYKTLIIFYHFLYNNILFLFVSIRFLYADTRSYLILCVYSSKKLLIRIRFFPSGVSNYFRKITWIFGKRTSQAATVRVISCSLYIILHAFNFISFNFYFCFYLHVNVKFFFSNFWSRVLF